MPLAPLEQLAKLLAEEKRVEEKIRQTRMTLTQIKKTISASLVQRYLAIKTEEVSLPEDLMKEEQSYERLLQALLNMKNEIANQIRPVEELITQANVNRLKEMSEQQKNRLQSCVDAIKERILECRGHKEEYDRIRTNLQSLNEEISRLGAEPLPIPEPLPSQDLESLIASYIAELRTQGKL